MAKIKTCNQQSQLEEHGVILDAKWAFNPVGVYKPKRQKIKHFFMDIDGTQASNRFKWVGLPDTIPSYLIEQMLYHRGTLVLFKEGNEFRILPYVSSGSLNIYGQMSEVKPLPYNGGALDTGKDPSYLSLDVVPVTIDYYGDADVDRRGVILYDRINGYSMNNKVVPKVALQEPICEEITNRLSFLNINMVNSQGKNIIVVQDPKQASAIEKALENVYASDKAFAIAKSMLDIKVINNDITYMEQQLWEDAMSWNNLRLMGLGIQNTGLFNKKERMITGEQSNNSEQGDIINDAFLQARKLFVENVKKVFGNDPDFQKQFKGFDVVDLRVRKVESSKDIQPQSEYEEVDDNDDNIMF